MRKHPRLAILIDRAIAKTISPSERDELLHLMADPTCKAEAEMLLEQAWDTFKATHPVFTEGETMTMLRGILAAPTRIRVTKGETRHIRSFYTTRWLKAAVVVILVSVATMAYFFHSNLKSPELTLAEAVEQYGIQPGSDKAILTLGDGRIIVLDDIENGLVATDVGVNIDKSDDGQLQYNQVNNGLGNVVYNDITIPKGGHFRLILPDGTRVHLNAESSLRYPTQFIGDRREVELVGEAYFEVASNKQQPFYVKTATQTTEVLGTVFNINAYADGDFVKTTLVEGSVKVSQSTGQSIILTPGQAAINESNQINLSVSMVNVDEELAWHNGYFMFNNEHINSIMQRVARWYDVDVEYEGNIQNKRFGGIFQRSKSILQLLENFKETGLIDFKITERRVIVMAK